MNKKGIAPIIIVLIISALVIGAGIIVYQSYKTRNKAITTVISTTTTTTNSLPTTVTLAKTTTSTTKSSFVVPSNWFVYKDTENGFEFSYPKHFFFYDPSVQIIDCTNYLTFLSTCTSKTAEEILSKANIVGTPIEASTKIVINNIPFCKNNNTEGAMGSTYDTTHFITIKNQKCIIISATIQTSNDCADAVNPTKCEETNQYYYTILDQVLSTFHFATSSGN